MVVFGLECVFFFKQKTAYEMRISDWSSDVCSSDLGHARCRRRAAERDVGLPFGFQPHAGDIDPVARAQVNVEAEQVEQRAARCGEAVARNARAARSEERRVGERVCKYV